MADADIACDDALVKRRLKNAEQCRQKRKSNPERYAAIAKRYRDANKQKCNNASKLAKRAQRLISREADAKYRSLNKDKRAASARAYREKNREAINAKERERRLKKLSDPSYVARCRASVSRYHKANPDRCRAIRRNRKARIRKAEGTHTAADVADIMLLQKQKCASPACRKRLKTDSYHVDHIVPIAKGGDNDRRNLQLLCCKCNQTKHDKDPLIWARQHGMLL